ncbi:DNA-processing protein DprA [Bacillus sp. FJAT-49736]|uniref:DNA-processing protein DprA n=1 Tax=Bacillus sp. FJAT-49736 TaxID=2833582 RepID=UPI001BC92DBA|nr:DNA-processing protein DprA [Bacillus sp. FJAT-49736]MBS4172505.1 DNA-processing protein DprA [Bacillus sp. FJAT-49736]
MEEFRKRLIHLHHCRGITSKAILALLKNDSSLQSLYQYSFTTLKSIIAGKGNQIEKIYQDLHHIPIDSLLLSYQRYQIKCITIFDQEYPNLLKQIYQPPIVLYAIGNLRLLHSPSIAIVGSRKADIYALQAIRRIIPPLVQKEFVIVSGVAKGVDTMAHKSTIECQGKTMGVLGSGFFHIYPQENIGLIENMKKDHLIISEYPPNTRPQRWHFPMRNRIISGLTKGTVIIQAEQKSGSLITAEYALQEGREVFAVPGNIYESLSQGTNKLIQQGAKLVQNGEDILEEFIY